MTPGVARRSRLPVVQQAAGPLWRMGADRLLYRFGSPAGRIGNDQVALLELRRDGKHLLVPREAIDIYLHDPKIRHRGGKMRIHHRGEMAIEIVRRDVDLERVGRAGDLDRLPHPISTPRR